MGLETQTINFIESLTRLAEQFGPFLFAILFIVFITRTARGYYDECMKRTSPPSTDQEQRTYRLYFFSSMWVGIVVMALSIGWWLYTQSRGNHVYQISILNLAPDEKIVSEYYSRTNVRQAIPGVAPHHDALFLVVRERPYTAGQTLSFQYVKQTPAAVASGAGSNPSIGSALTPSSIEVKYSGGKLLSYRVVHDTTGPRLESVAQDDSASPIFTAEEIDRAVRRYASAQPAQ